MGNSNIKKGLSSNQIENYINEKTMSRRNNILQASLYPECITIKKTSLGNIFSDYHHHDLYEILYIKTGKVSYSIEDTKIILQPGDVIFISPDKLHKLNEIITSKSDRIVLNFSEKLILQCSTRNTNLLRMFSIMNKNNNFKISIPEKNKEKIDMLINTLLNVQFSNEYGDDLLLINTFSILLLTFNKIFSFQSSEDVKINNAIVSQINDFITNNIEKKLLIEDIANNVNLSVSRVQHIFKDETGTSIKQYINKKRLVKAKELLRSEAKIVDVYDKCGFQDYTSFFRAFKKEYGITPRDYKANVEKNFYLPN